MRYFIRYYLFVLKILIKTPHSYMLIFIALLSLLDGRYFLALFVGILMPLAVPVYLYFTNSPITLIE